MREKRGHGIPHLLVLSRSASLEEVIVGKCLDTGRLAYGQATNLKGIGVDIGMAILRDVTSDRSSKAIPRLHLESICELAEVLFLALHIRVIRQQGFRKVF